MTETLFADDCSRCADLCCIALAFDRGLGFGLDKPAGQPCPNLAPRGGCRIHRERLDRGFAGCVAFSCAGAGPRVTQELFDGASWRQDERLLIPMSKAFGQARRLHDWLLLLREAERLPLSRAQRADVARLRGDLTPPGKLTQDWLDRVATDRTGRRVMEFLSSLRPLVESGPP